MMWLFSVVPLISVWPATLVAQLPADGLSANFGWALSTLILAYILGLPALGHLLDINGFSLKGVLRVVLFSIYAAAVSLTVWPLAIVLAAMMRSRSDWIFHTPHQGADNTYVSTGTRRSAPTP